MSSLGFYRTALTIYVAKYGLSLKIAGMDPGFNSNAESRAVVVHGAEYVCDDFVKAHGRLVAQPGLPGPASSRDGGHCESYPGGGVLYLHGPAGAGYQSQWLNVDTAVSAFASQHGGAGRVE